MAEKENEFVDERDGHVYKTVRIGEQTWLAENLRFDCAGSSVYENEDRNLDRYGRLYTWRSALNSAPPGWHLPTGEETRGIIERAGGWKAAGEKFKSREGWNDGGNGTDEFGFRALPAGFADRHGKFWHEGKYSYFWTSELDSSDPGKLAISVGIDFHYGDLRHGCSEQECRYSVRLVRDG